MSNPSKRKGTAWESAIVAALHRAGRPHVERRTLMGGKDCGDIAGIPGIVIEAKSVAKINLAQFLDEATTEADNAGADLGVAWIKRRGKAAAEHGYVVMSGADFMALIREAGY